MEILLPENPQIICNPRARNLVIRVVAESPYQYQAQGRAIFLSQQTKLGKSEVARDRQNYSPGTNKPSANLGRFDSGGVNQGGT